MVRISDKPMIIYFVYLGDEIVYIGQTVMTLAQRKGKHLSEARLGRGSILGAGIRKHGEEAFVFKKHSIVFNQSDLDSAEKHYIAKYSPRYNVQAGGKIGFPGHNKGKKETRPEVIAKIKASAKNRKRTKRGPATPEQNKARIEGQLNHIRGTARPFICHQNGKTYWLKIDAASELGISAQGIRDVLCPAHKMQSYKGYTFSYIEDVSAG